MRRLIKGMKVLPIRFAGGNITKGKEYIIKKISRKPHGIYVMVDLDSDGYKDYDFNYSLFSQYFGNFRIDDVKLNNRIKVL